MKADRDAKWMGGLYMLLLVACSAAACGGGGQAPVATLESTAGNVVATDTTRSVGLLINESEIATLPVWQQEKMSDAGWNQPYIAPPAETDLVAPTGDMLLEYMAAERERGNTIRPRIANGRDASWTDLGPWPGEIQYIQGEYDNVLQAGTPSFGCNNDASNGNGPKALEDVVAAGVRSLPEVLCEVRNGWSYSNWFNTTGGSGNDAQSAVYQVFSSDRNGNPEDWEFYDFEYEELTYRADLAPGIGPGGDCSAAEAFLVSGLIWKRFNSRTNALPNLDECYQYDILIAPSSAQSELITSDGNTDAHYQEFYFGTMESCFGGGWIVALESSTSGCAAFNTAVAEAYAAGDPFYTSPVYGLLLKRWQQMQLAGMAGPWESEMGWPVFGPVAFNNGAPLMSLQGTYYAWGMWFERGFMAWVDYDQEQYPETPDEVQLFRFTGSNVFCPMSGEYKQVKPSIKYGGTAPWPAAYGQPRVNIVVDSCRYEPTDDWWPVAQNNLGEYEIALPDSGESTVEVAMHAHAWGGSPNPDCSYDYYVWAFRDGTIYMGDEAAAQSVTHTYGSETRNLEGTYIVRVQVSDSTGAVAYGDSRPIVIGHGGAAAMVGPDMFVINNADGWHEESYEALLSDLYSLDIRCSEYRPDPELMGSIRNSKLQLIIWYRGGPANASENEAPPREWTTEEIDFFQQILLEGIPILLVSQDHGYYHDEHLSTGWRQWYNWDEEDLSPSITMGDERFLWCLGMTEVFGVFGSGQYGMLKFSPRNLPTYATIGSKLPDDGYDIDGLQAAEYCRVGEDGDVPLKISFGEPPRLVGYGFYSKAMGGNTAPGFVAGLNLDNQFEGQFDLAFVSGGCKQAPYYDVGLWPPPYNFSNHGDARVWWIGYPWATTEVTESETGEMVGPDKRHLLLKNILHWLKPKWNLDGAGGAGGGFSEYFGPPEIIQVNVGTWEAGGYEYSPGSLTWDGTAGDYPDQTMPNAYMSSTPIVGDYVVTTSRNNDWINGNDVDFSFPWYAYIVDVNGDGVQMGAGNNVDDTVTFGGLLLEDLNDAWEREQNLVPPLELRSYGIDPVAPDNGVPSAVIDGFSPPVVVAGYYISTTGDLGGEVRASYGTAPASLAFDNDTVLTAECVAHWPPNMYYGGTWLPGGGYFQSQDPALIWSMYPGQNMAVPEAYNSSGARRIELTPMGWDSYRFMFDVDPSVANAARDAGDPWNRSVFLHTTAHSQGRVVYFDYGNVPNWNPDLNRDGDDNSLGINDTADKFPIRVRLITEYEDYVFWNSPWPDHWPDAGIDPALGGPIWWDDVNDPPMFFADWPDYIEGGAYVVDTGAPVYD